MKIDSLINIKQGDIQITRVYQANTIVWENEDIPAWPEEYFKPNGPYGTYGDRGVYMFYRNIPKNSVLTWRWKSDDNEGEGGDYQYRMETKNGYVYIWDGRYSQEIPSLTLRENFENGWVSFCTNFDMQYIDFGNLISYTPSGMIVNNHYSYGGDDFDYSGWQNSGLTNFEFFGIVNSYYDTADTFISYMPNLKYFFCEESGKTFTLSGSTSWTKESMKFTEYNSPNTTFIVRDNNYWRSIIDWDIATKRNVIFKDENGNVMGG